MKTAIVIPAYNEAATIAEVARGARAFCERVIVVDDGSTDGTSAALAGMSITLLQNEFNRGKGASIVRGQQHALKLGAEAVITLDGDGQHRAEDVPRFLAAAEKHPGTLIIGARIRNVEQAPRWRRFGNRCANFWISWAAGIPILDTQTGFRLYPAEVLRRTRVKTARRHSFVYESAILIESARRGFPVHHVPIDTLYPPGGRPSHFRPFLDNPRIVMMVAWKLISWLGYPQGLLRSTGILPPRRAPADGKRGSTGTAH